MAETSPLTIGEVERAGADVVVAPEARGRLTISDTAVQHLAEGLARGVRGTVTHTSMLRKLGGRAFPRAQASVRGERVWVSLDVAATWPCAAGRIAEQVRDRVLTEAGRLTGLAIETVDVTLHVVDAEPPETRRVQ